MRIKILLFCLLIPISTFGSGLDLTLFYGSKYVGMGGQQIALATDAYAPFYNPAGMIRVESATLAVNSSTLLNWYEAPIGGANLQKKSDLTLGPLFYLGGVYRLTDRIAVGLGAYPTALQGGTFSDVDYGTGLTGKQFSVQLFRIEVAPSIAIRVIDNLSIGLSYRMGYTQLKKKTGVFETTIGSTAVPAAFLDSSLSQWDAKGVKLGAFYDGYYGLSFALTWRFKMKITLEGETKVNEAVSLPTRQRVAIPAQLQAGVAYEVIPERLKMALAYEFTGNSVIRNSDSTVDGLGALTGSGTDVVAAPTSWKDGHTLHFGGDIGFKIDQDEKVNLMAGIAYDKAVTRKGKPTPGTAPAGDYVGYALGGQYRWGAHTFGTALNYGQYSHSTATIDADVHPLTGGVPVSIFPGKYGLKALLTVLDYQYTF